MTGATRAPHGRTDFAARFVVRAAMTAPSMHNTQPWSFASSRDVISVYADPVRALPHTDPAGREIVISGGAALFNLRLAMHHLGFASQAQLLPQTGRLDHLADVRWGRYSRPTAYDELLYRAMTRRRTHHGRFSTAPVPAALITELVRLVYEERATLHVVSGTEEIRTLAELVRKAEMAQRAELGIATERARWTAAAGGGRRTDGMAARAADRTASGPAFADRQYGPDPQWPTALPHNRANVHGLGVVVVLATQEDRPLDWLRAGQVLQRLLLHATAHHVSAAFHTQPLELPDYRRRIQAEFAAGAYPQLLLRLGHADHDPKTPRRPVTDALREH
ncbi:MAG TPA: hypothetical protein VFU43_09035 [Streptosporangiaceae bacterium]|nr:hypothetical protein [Streptosporangiaceae bacterium]